MLLTFRPIDQWPPEWPRDPRAHSPFKATYADTRNILDRELDKLDAMEAFLQIDVKPGGVRNDGQLRADARASNQGVILTVETKRLGSLVYSCDMFGLNYYGQTRTDAWQHNLRAIALGLEALRKVERYGIADRGEQYAGYKALGSGIPMGPPTMTPDEAANLITMLAAEAGGTNDPVGDAELILAGDPDLLARLYKRAAKRLHPDHGGDPEQFKLLQEAKALLAR